MDRKGRNSLGGFLDKLTLDGAVLMHQHKFSLNQTRQQGLRILFDHNRTLIGKDLIQL
jgi:hypothetical protein